MDLQARKPPLHELACLPPISAPAKQLVSMTSVPAGSRKQEWASSSCQDGQRRLQFGSEAGLQLATQTDESTSISCLQSHDNFGEPSAPRSWDPPDVQEKRAVCLSHHTPHSAPAWRDDDAHFLHELEVACHTVAHQGHAGQGRGGRLLPEGGPSGRLKVVLQDLGARPLGASNGGAESEAVLVIGNVSAIVRVKVFLHYPVPVSGQC